MADFTQNLPSGSSSTAGSSHDTAAMDMAMTFVVSTATPLFSAAWTPRTLGQYVGTCVFLIALSFVFRFVLAWKQVLEHRWARAEAARKPVVVVGGGGGGSSEEDLNKEPQKDEKAKPSSDGSSSSGSSSSSSSSSEGWSGRPWRFSTELPRAALTVVSTGLGYLL